MTASSATNGELLARCLQAAGIGTLYGEVIPGPAVVPVSDPAVAVLLAAADSWMRRGPGAGSLPGRTIRFCGLAGQVPISTTTVADPADLVEAVVSAAARAATASPETTDVVVDLDLAAPAPASATTRPVPPPPSSESWTLPDGDVVAVLRAAQRPVVLAGPGVARAGTAAVAGLHAMAAAANVGVLNTWGAKGIFDWRSVRHLATAGLQRDDFTLGGLADADLIVAVGVDEAEAGNGLWRIAPTITLGPCQLAPVAEVWHRDPMPPPATVPLRERLATLVSAWWQATAAPLGPARAVADMAEVLGPRGLVTADPGVAGLWVARTFATTTLGSVSVPARSDTQGWAPACALCARLADPTRPVLAVTTGSDPDDPTQAVLEVGRRLGVGIPMALWSGDAAPLDSAAHRSALADAVAGTGESSVAVAVDGSNVEDLVDVAGPVIAWQ